MARRGRLTTLDSDVPGTIPVANEAARIAAQLIGGDAGSSINEVVLGTPTTAHILGGACVDAVVDRYHRVLDAPGLHVVDGAAVNANLGVNPSLTIAAQAERACSLWPNAGRRGSAAAARRRPTHGSMPSRRRGRRCRPGLRSVARAKRLRA